MPEKLPNRQHDNSRKGPKRQRNSSLFKGWTSPAPSNLVEPGQSSNIAKYVNHHRVLRQGAFFWSSSVRVG